jgi:hypothetical protein
MRTKLPHLYRLSKANVEELQQDEGWVTYEMLWVTVAEALDLLEGLVQEQVVVVPSNPALVEPSQSSVVDP